MEKVSDSNRASNRGTNARKVTDPRRGRTKKRGNNSLRLAAAWRITARAPAAPGRQENRQAEAQASPEGEVSRLKRQPADIRQSRAGGSGSRPTAGKKAPEAAGRKTEAPTEAQTPAGRKQGRVPKTTPDP